MTTKNPTIASSLLGADNFESRVYNLRVEAGAAGDEATVADCELVLLADWANSENPSEDVFAAALRCAETIVLAEANDDDDDQPGDIWEV